MPRKRLPSAGGNRTDLQMAPVQGATVSQLRPPNPQPAQAPTGQPYGASGQQIAAQHAMPLPAVAAGPSPAVPPPPGAVPGQVPQPAGPYAGSQLQAAARAMPFDSLGLGGPSQRPNEPVTTPMAPPTPYGAPAATSMANSTIADTLARLAQTEPALNEFVNRARAQGL